MWHWTDLESLRFAFCRMSVILLVEPKSWLVGAILAKPLADSAIWRISCHEHALAHNILFQLDSVSNFHFSRVKKKKRRPKFFYVDPNFFTIVVNDFDAKKSACYRRVLVVTKTRCIRASVYVILVSESIICSRSISSSSDESVVAELSLHR